jgi:hypothetical protein
MYRSVTNTFLALLTLLFAYSCSDSGTKTMNGITRSVSPGPGDEKVVSFSYFDTVNETGKNIYAGNLLSYCDEGWDGTLNVLVTAPAILEGNKTIISPWFAYRLVDDSTDASGYLKDFWDEKTGEFLGTETGVFRGSEQGAGMQEDFEKVKEKYRGK